MPRNTQETEDEREIQKYDRRNPIIKEELDLYHACIKELPLNDSNLHKKNMSK